LFKFENDKKQTLLVKKKKRNKLCLKRKLINFIEKDKSN